MHASEMYLVTLVNATFVGRRPTGHVELVDLSVSEKKTVEQRYNDKQQQLRSHGGAENLKASDAVDLCMEPLFPLFLGSPSSSDSSEADTRERQILQLEPKPQPVVPLKQQEQVDPSDKEVDKNLDVDTTMKTIKPSKVRVAPKLGSLFSDGGISTRVQRHPLEMIAEQERDGDSDSSPGTSMRITSSAPVLPHPLARVDESPVRVRPMKVSSVKENPVKENERKATLRKEQKSSTVAIPAPAPKPVRKVVRAAKPQPQKREQQRRAPMTKPTRSDCPKPRSCPKPKVPEAKQRPAVSDPSLANPVMERMPQIASPEPQYAWSKKLPNLPKLEVRNMDMEDPDQLRYSSPKMTEWDAQDDLSFRVWERESNPKRKSISVSRDFQDSLDLEDVDQPTLPTQSNSPPGEKTKPDLRRKKGAEAVEPECPSPSSFSCGLSSTSLFSDEESDAVDEAEFNRRSFSTFIYSDPMGETSSDDGAESDELRYFQEAGHREPWLVDTKDGAAVLDDTDLQFLLKDEPAPEISTEDVTSPAAPPPATHVRRHSRSSSLSKPKRSVRFAPELVRKMSAPRTSIRLPPLAPPRDDDDQIYPSVKSWEVDDDEDTAASTPRRSSWRRSPSPKPTDPASRPRWHRPCAKVYADQASTPTRRRDQILPCAGRLFSWPQRLASRVSRSRRLDVSDDDSVDVAGNSSFGGSASRDAQQVRRILRGSAHKNAAVASNLKVAHLLDENFAR